MPQIDLSPCLQTDQINLFQPEMFVYIFMPIGA